MKITTEKKLVLEKIVDWLKDKNRPQYITLGGYAGTGKTTLIAIIRRIFHKKNSMALIKINE